MRFRRSTSTLVLSLVLVATAGCSGEDARQRLAWLNAQMARRFGIAAVFMPFEHGFMAYAQGADCLYAYADGIILPREVVAAYNNYRYCLPFGDLPAAPPGLPAGAFGQVWSHYPEVKNALGAPTGEAVHYRASIPPPDPVIMGGVFYGGMITLPDGTMLYCGMRAATAGTCQLR